MMMKVLIENWKVLLLPAEENMEGKKVYVYEICGKECVSSRGLKRHDTLKHTREGTSKTEEKPKKTVLPTLQISQFEEIVKECAKLCHGDSCFFAWRHKKENSKVKNPFRRFWIRPVISSHVCEFMDDVFDKLKKACLLFDDQNLIPTFFSEAENSFWRFRKSDRVETWKCAKKNTVNL